MILALKTPIQGFPKTPRGPVIRGSSRNIARRFPRILGLLGSGIPGFSEPLPGQQCKEFRARGSVGYNPFMPSYPHIEEYRAKLQELIEFGGSDNEENIRPAFQNCLDAYCRGPPGTTGADPGTEDLLRATNPTAPSRTVLRMARGYWEAKDSHDDLDAEIQVKFNRGYPKDNILFEDSQTAVLVQNASVAMRVDMSRDGAYPPAPWIPESKVNRFASSNVLFTAPLHRLAMEVSLLLVLRVRARI